MSEIAWDWMIGKKSEELTEEERQQLVGREAEKGRGRERGREGEGEGEGERHPDKKTHRVTVQSIPSFSTQTDRQTRGYKTRDTRIPR